MLCVHYRNAKEALAKEKEANVRRKSSIFSSFALTGTSKASKDKEQGGDRDGDNFEKDYEDKEEVDAYLYSLTCYPDFINVFLCRHTRSKCPARSWRLIAGNRSSSFTR